MKDGYEALIVIGLILITIAYAAVGLIKLLGLLS